MAELKDAGQREYTFRHILTRDVAYESLPRRERQRAHTLVATWIEERAGERRASTWTCSPITTRSAPLRERRRRPRRRGTGTAEGRGVRLRAHGIAAGQGQARAARRRGAGGARAHSLHHHSIARGHSRHSARPRFLIPTGIERGSACDRRWTTGGRREGPIRGRSRGLCAKALEVPTRRGLDADEAGTRRGQSVPGARDLERGGGDSEELARLLIVKAFWPASLGEGRGTEAEELEARESGEEAAAMAIRLGGRISRRRRSTESASSSRIGAAGPWSGSRPAADLAGSLTDPVELGDIYAMASWCSYHVGRHRDTERYATEG